MRLSRPVLLVLPLTLAAAAPAGAAPPTTPRVLPAAGAERIPFAITDRGRAVGLKRGLQRSLPRRGASVGIACANVPDPLGGPAGEVSTSTTVRRGVRLQIPKGYDFCVVEVRVVKRTKRSTTITTPASANVALNPAGAEFLHERDLAALMASATQLAVTGVGGDRTPTSAQVAEGLATARVLGRPVRVVSTPAPRTQVPAGTVGVFLDGTRSSVTATTPGGRRLHLDYDRTTREIATNVLPALNDTTGDDLLSDDA